MQLSEISDEQEVCESDEPADYEEEDEGKKDEDSGQDPATDAVEEILFFACYYSMFVTGTSPIIIQSDRSLPANLIESLLMSCACNERVKLTSHDGTSYGELVHSLLLFSKFDFISRMVIRMYMDGWVCYREMRKWKDVK
jgi:hypothetical protein